MQKSPHISSVFALLKYRDFESLPSARCARTIRQLQNISSVENDCVRAQPSEANEKSVPSEIRSQDVVACAMT